MSGTNLLFSRISAPIEADLVRFNELFTESLSHSDGLLNMALQHILQRSGKLMRPKLMFLIASNFAQVNEVTQHAAVGLELLHTASLVHDDVVDESAERRGQQSVNAVYDNKIAVLIGDYILSTALLYVNHTHSHPIVEYLSLLGQTLSNGEINQLQNLQKEEISEELYYDVIRQKTAALFESCAAIGALSCNAPEEEVEAAKLFGQRMGIMFQIRDDIFDYYEDSAIGKPTGNDMAEGKLTLPVIYAVNATGDESMRCLALKVRNRTVSSDEIAQLVAFTKENGGIEYAQQRMSDFHTLCLQYIDHHIRSSEIRDALLAYIDFTMSRSI